MGYPTDRDFEDARSGGCGHGPDFNWYQREAMRTAAKTPNQVAALAVAGLGLTGEAGEVADLIKKIVGHGHPLDAEVQKKLVKELGDVMWYVALTCDTLKISMEAVAQANIMKLKERYPSGFSTEASMNRKDK